MIIPSNHDFRKNKPSVIGAEAKGMIQGAFLQEKVSSHTKLLLLAYSHSSIDLPIGQQTS